MAIKKDEIGYDISVRLKLKGVVPKNPHATTAAAAEQMSEDLDEFLGTFSERGFRIEANGKIRTRARGLPSTEMDFEMNEELPEAEDNPDDEDNEEENNEEEDEEDED